MLRKIILLILFFTFAVFAQEKEWDVTKHHVPFKEAEFELDEGTWMNLDVSPNGKQIVFDLLGDIYSMPIEGGDAKLLRGGLAFEVQPRFSPDGQQISFTSDAGGGDNIWIMNSDGSDAKQITEESFRLLNNATWTPDGNYLVARKHFTSGRSLGAGEMWIYHKSGGTGFQLTEKKNLQQDAGEPVVSPDGKFVYYSEDMYPGGYFQYNKDPNSQIYIIRRYDRERGEIENVITGPGGAVRPQLSPNGKFLSFVKRVRTKTVLYIHNLHSGEERPVYDKLSKDQQEAWAIFGVYPNYQWLPDNETIVFWADGKIRKVNINSYQSEIIPFKLTSKHKIADALKFRIPVHVEKFESHVMRHAVTSPDEKQLVFNSVGYLWTKTLPNGNPVRLTKSKDFESEPSFSPDGSKLVYVTWNDLEMGALILMDLKSGSTKKLNTEKGIYREPKFSPDGKTIVFRKESGNSEQGYTFTKKPGIYTISTSGGDEILVSESGSKPRFNSDGTRIYYLTGFNNSGDWWKKYESVNLQGFENRTHFTSKYANDFVISPDDKWVAFTELYKVYIMPFPEIGKEITLSANAEAIAIAQVARDEGINLQWNRSGTKLHWTLGNEYFTNAIQDRFKFVEGAPDSIPPIDTTGIKINLVLESDKPSGRIALTGAKIITMNGDEIIENGTIVINENLIEAVGPAENVTVPSDAKTINVSGKTIMPGIIDVHAHLGTWRDGLSPQQQWSYYANLAYGITTTHDPSSNSEMVFTQSEMVKAGHMVGPRIYSTGTILYGAEGDFKTVVNNLDDARSAIRRMKAYGAFSVKSYNQPRRNQRQQVIKAASENGVMVYPEGGSTFFHNLSMILDGHTGIEHNLPIAPLYKDVINLWSNSGTGSTPTLVVSYGAVSGEYYWYQHTNVWEKERLLNYYPRQIIDSRSRHRTMIPEEEYKNGHILVSESLKKLTDAGVKVNVGGHGQLQGLGVQWEMWMLGQGGMTNMEVLRAATMNGASYIGMDEEIGSLESGKLADLIVLDKDPLENIRNTEFVKYTMINGRIYDAETMNEIGNHDVKRGKFFWENNNYNQSFDWHEESNSQSHSRCSCGR
ncbi:MAG: amidohydrolase family protein [Melioribacteraceae bacterium]|nr:amidohydrolase family protein [Melioribacteraceae bacterium]